MSKWIEVKREPIPGSTIVRPCSHTGYYAVMQWRVWEKRPYESGDFEHRMREEAGQALYSYDEAGFEVEDHMAAINLLMRSVERVVFANDVEFNKKQSERK